jgi:hypothetical protein
VLIANDAVIVVASVAHSLGVCTVVEEWFSAFVQLIG